MTVMPTYCPCFCFDVQVPGVPRRGGAAAARTCELLADAEAVFERLLALAAQHPANYIIDGCK